jgi:perosamine synthetase
MERFIPVNEPLLDGKELDYLADCIKTGWISSEGSYVKQFEKNMAKLVVRKHGVAVCNGTAALELAMASLDLEPGSEVIMPTFTIISCAAAIIRQGCMPVLIDSDPVTWNMDVNQIEEKITERTRAIMVVHIYGLPVDMKPVLELADKYGLKIIEDAAEMHGQTYKGKHCGSFGDISIFSFYPNKHITTGEGGMVLTDNDFLAERARSLRNLCFQPGRRFVHEELGYNFRMTNLQAALGLAQLERINEFVERKRQMGALYSEQLAGLTQLRMPLNTTSYAENIYWVYGLVLDEKIAYSAEDVMNRLSEKGVGTRPFFWPMHEQPIFKRMGLFSGESYPVAQNLGRRGFYLPSGLALKQADIIYVAEALKSVMREINIQ